MRQLFDPAAGIGVSFLRQPIGSSDFTAAAAHYTYDDVPAGQTDFGLARFSIAHDEAQILPLLRRARQLNPRLTIMATPWSPPAWMKTTDSLVGGRLKDDPAVVRRVRPLSREVRAGLRGGRGADRLPVGAERAAEPQPVRVPGHRPAGRASRRRSSTRSGRCCARPARGRRSCRYDHNWATHPNDIASTPPGEDPATDYPYQILAGPAATLGRRHGVPLLLRRPERPDRAAQRLPGQGHLVHRVLRLARPDRPAGPVLPRHAGLARPQHRDRHDPQLGRSPSSPGTSRSTRPAVRTSAAATPAPALVTVQPDGTCPTNAEYYTVGHLSQVREARRGPHRQHVVRHHRLERPDHGRRLPQPGRLDRAGGAQRERRSALVRRRRSATASSTTRCPAARWPPSPGPGPLTAYDGCVQ